jgi:hypothetical protein
MIQFHHRTIWAELNALPCWPDRFEVIVPHRDRITGDMYTAELYKFMKYVRDTGGESGEFVEDGVIDRKFTWEIAVPYRRVKANNYGSLTTQDLILEKYRRTMTDAGS